jgi:hypothetical protein
MVIALAIYVCFAYSDRVERVLGNAGTDIVVRLTAFILFCLGVQIVWTGTSELLGTITPQKAAIFMIPVLNDVRPPDVSRKANQ